MARTGGGDTGGLRPSSLALPSLKRASHGPSPTSWGGGWQLLKPSTLAEFSAFPHSLLFSWLLPSSLPPNLLSSIPGLPGLQCLCQGTDLHQPPHSPHRSLPHMFSHTLSRACCVLGSPEACLPVTVRACTGQVPGQSSTVLGCSQAGLKAVTTTHLHSCLLPPIHLCCHGVHLMPMVCAPCSGLSGLLISLLREPRSPVACTTSHLLPRLVHHGFPPLVSFLKAGNSLISPPLEYRYKSA